MSLVSTISTTQQSTMLDYKSSAGTLVFPKTEMLSVGTFQPEVVFKKYLTKQDLIKEIARIKNPQVIFWYIGEKGLSDIAVGLYGKFIRQIQSLKNSPKLILYDLTAWAAFENASNKIDAINKNVKVIDDFAIPNLRCMMSRDFFTELVSEKDPRLISYYRDVVLIKDWIFDASKQFADTGIKVGEVISKCPILAKVVGRDNVIDKDTGKSYSAFQYLEGIFLIDKILSAEIAKDQNEINIVFALPNDEWKYYENGNSFANDVGAIIAEKYGEKLKGKKVNLFFYTFQFGVTAAQCQADTPEALNALKKRPYNMGKVMDITDRKQIT